MFRPAAVVSALVLLSCGAEAPATNPLAQFTIYGTDDRQDVYAHPDETLRSIARASTAVMVSSVLVNTTDPNNVTFRAQTLGQQNRLCSGVRFANDPAAGSCSGTLIGEDLVLTAGHCVTSTRQCQGVSFVFDYYRDDATTLHPITRDDVYPCSAVVVHGSSDRPQHDYAVVRLNRPVTGEHRPAVMHPTHFTYPSGAPVTVIGFPTGIPAKIDTGGRVRSSNAAEFVATTDTFGGNSGSGVFDGTDYTLRGILIEGDTDFDRTSAGCYTLHTCTATGCRGETIGYAFYALDSLCAAQPDAFPCLGDLPDGGRSPRDAAVREPGPEAGAGDAGDAFTPMEAGEPMEAAVPGDDEGTGGAMPAGCKCSTVGGGRTQPARAGWILVALVARAGRRRVRGRAR